MIDTEENICIFKYLAERIDLSGQKIDRLLVKRPAPSIKYKDGSYKSRWYCDCDCGTKDYIAYTTYLRGKAPVKSCGCYKSEVHYKSHKKFNKYDLTGEFGIGYTAKGEKFYFDLEDYDKIKDFSWHISHGYVCSQIDRDNRIRMHRYILGATADTVDHINGVTYDNRKSNLREATYQQNNTNVKAYKNNSSGHKGVYFDKERNLWYSDITVNYKTVHLGRFNTKEEAIQAWKNAEEKYQKEWSVTNSQKYAKENDILLNKENINEVTTD